MEYFWTHFFTTMGLDTPQLDHQTLFAYIPCLMGRSPSDGGQSHRPGNTNRQSSEWSTPLCQLAMPTFIHVRPPPTFTLLWAVLTRDSNAQPVLA